MSEQANACVRASLPDQDRRERCQNALYHRAAEDGVAQLPSGIERGQWKHQDEGERPGARIVEIELVSDLVARSRDTRRDVVD